MKYELKIINYGHKFRSECPDLNREPLAPEASALPLSHTPKFTTTAFPFRIPIKSGEGGSYSTPITIMKNKHYNCRQLSYH